MKFNKNIVVINSVLLFFQIFISVIGTDIFNTSVPFLNYYFDVIVLFAFLSFLISLCSPRIMIKELLFIICWFIVAVITFVTSQDLLVLANFLMIISVRVLTIPRVIKIVFWANLVSLIFSFAMYNLGWIRDNTNGTITKHSLGLSHPNQLGAVLLVIILCSIYLFIHGSTQQKLLLTVLVVVLYLLLIYSGSRGALISAILSNFVLIIFYLKPKTLFLICLLVGVFFLIFSLYSTGSSVYQSGSLLNKLDGIFTNRIRMNNYFMSNYGVKALGQRIVYSGGSDFMYHYDYAYLDNGYLRNLINFGLLYSILFYTYYILIIKKIKELQMYSLFVVIIPLLIYGFIEEGFTSFLINMTLLFTSILFISNQRNGVNS
ncbi:hypothetical protein [Weissella paramesenteroides]|uniref:hypothetical protein n=1 Tax=Weissella paramesenteroides TaxID=1249 RepID=UPI003D3652FE